MHLISHQLHKFSLRYMVTLNEERQEAKTCDKGAWEKNAFLSKCYKVIFMTDKELTETYLTAFLHPLGICKWLIQKGSRPLSMLKSTIILLNHFRTWQDGYAVSEGQILCTYSGLVASWTDYARNGFLR